MGREEKNIRAKQSQGLLSSGISDCERISVGMVMLRRDARQRLNGLDTQIKGGKDESSRDLSRGATGLGWKNCTWLAQWVKLRDERG